MTPPTHREIVGQGLWHNNPGFVQLLGLCPLLAVSNSAVNALGLGFATTLVLLASNATISLIRPLLRPEVRLPVFVLVIASFVTATELIMNAYFHRLYTILGIFIPLIVTNCAIIARAEAFAARHDVGRAAVDGLAMGIGFSMVLLLVGSVRELLGQGTWLAQAELLFGPGAAGWEVTLIPNYRGFLLAILPPGAFMVLGVLIAAKNWLDNRWCPVVTVALDKAEASGS